MYLFGLVGMPPKVALPPVSLQLRVFNVVNAPRSVVLRPPRHGWLSRALRFGRHGSILCYRLVLEIGWVDAYLSASSAEADTGDHRTMGEAAFKVQDAISGRRLSQLRKYQQMVVGSVRWWDLIKYEMILFFVSRLPGALGLLLRGKLYPLLLGEVGRGVVFGANITLRHPQKIRIGDGVIIDDYALLDAKGDGNQGITIGRETYIGRSSILTCKDGDIELGERADIGSNSYIFSGSLVRVGRNALIGSHTCFIGGGNYDLDQIDGPLNQTLRDRSARGIRVADDVWIGAHTVILDGVSVGGRSVVAAGAVVTKAAPGCALMAGVPARVVKERARPRGA